MRNFTPLDSALSIGGVMVTIKVSIVPLTGHILERLKEEK